VLYRATELIAYPALRGYFRPQVTGRAGAARGRCNPPANHLSAADQVVTPICARAVRCLLREGRVLRPARHQEPPAGALLPRARARAGGPRRCPSRGQHHRNRADLLRRRLRAGNLPGGTRSPDGRLHKFRTGVARLALRSGAPSYRSGWSGPTTCSSRGRSAGGGCTSRCTSARRWTSPAGPRTSGRPLRARGDEIVRGPWSACPDRSTSTATRADRRRRAQRARLGPVLEGAEAWTYCSTSSIVSAFGPRRHPRLLRGRRRSRSPWPWCRARRCRSTRIRPRQRSSGCRLAAPLVLGQIRVRRHVASPEPPAAGAQPPHVGDGLGPGPRSCPVS